MKNRITSLLSGFILAITCVNGQAPVTSFTATPNPVCACTPVDFTDLSSNTPTQYKWSFPGGTPSTSTAENPIVIYCTPGMYTVTEECSNAHGKDSLTITDYINVIAPPVVTVTPASGGICVAGTDSVCLTVSGANTYTWAPTGLLNGMECASCPNPCVSPTVTTTYTVVGTSTVTGCMSAPITVTVYVGKIKAKIEGIDSICMGYSDTLRGSGGTSPVVSVDSNPKITTYLWSTGSTLQNIVVSPIVETIYTLTITQGSCFSQTTFTVTPFALPVFSLLGADSVCAGGCTEITASPGEGVYKYVWFNGASYDYYTNEYLICPQTTTNINLFVTNKGCTIDSVFTIKVANLTNVVIKGAANLCQGSSTTLTAYGGTSYKWSTGQTTSSITVAPFSDKTYSVTAKEGACTKDTTFTVIVDSMPQIKFTGPPYAPWKNALDTAVCTNDSTIIYVVDKLGNGEDAFYWTPGGSTVDTITFNRHDSLGLLIPKYHIVILAGDTDTIDNYVQTNRTTTYTIKVTKGACSLDTTLTIKVYPHPHGRLVDSLNGGCLCQFDSVKLVATGGNYYQWFPRNSGLSHYGIKPFPPQDTDINMASPLVPTIYTVYVHTWGCYDTAYDTVCVYEGAQATVSASADTVSSGSPVQLTATPLNGQTGVVSWTSATGNLNSSTGYSVTATPDITSWYYVNLINLTTSCTFKDSIKIDIFNCNIFVPDIFSPSQSTNNILYVDSYCIKTMDFAVYDRWGNAVFQYSTTGGSYAFHSPGSGWDGTFHGKPMEIGTYIWYVTAVEYDGTIVHVHGNTALIR